MRLYCNSDFRDPFNRVRRSDCENYAQVYAYNNALPTSSNFIGGGGNGFLLIFPNFQRYIFKKFNRAQDVKTTTDDDDVLARVCVCVCFEPDALKKNERAHRRTEPRRNKAYYDFDQLSLPRALAHVRRI